MAAAAALVPARAAAQSNLPKLPNVRKSEYSTTETPTSFEDITSYNNFYEFGTDKDDPSATRATFVTRPWTIEVEGLVDKPGTFDIDRLHQGLTRSKSASTACAASRGGRW